MKDMKETQEIHHSVQEEGKESIDFTNADITPFMTNSKIKVTLERKVSGNRIKGSKISAKHHMAKARASHPVSRLKGPKVMSQHHIFNSSADDSMREHTEETSSVGNCG